MSKNVNLDFKVGIFFWFMFKVRGKFNFCDGKFDIIISYYNFGFEKGF